MESMIDAAAQASSIAETLWSILTLVALIFSMITLVFVIYVNRKIKKLNDEIRNKYFNGMSGRS